MPCATDGHRRENICGGPSRHGRVGHRSPPADRRRSQSALLNYNKAVEENPDPNFVLTQAALLGNIGQEKLALEHIEYYKRIVDSRHGSYNGMQWLHNKLLSYFGYHESELLRLEKMLSESTKTKPDLILN